VYLTNASQQRGYLCLLFNKHFVKLIHPRLVRGTDQSSFLACSTWSPGILWLDSILSPFLPHPCS
jgi:hypothetical protein